MASPQPEEDTVSVESGLDLLAQLCQKRLSKKRTFGEDFVTEEEPLKKGEATSAPPSQSGPTQSRGGLEQLLHAVVVDIDESDVELQSPAIESYHRGTRAKRARASSANALTREGSPGPQSSGTVYSNMPDSPRAVSSPEANRGTDSPLMYRLRHAAKKRSTIAGAAEAMLLMGMAAAPKASRLRKESHQDVTTEEEDGSGDPDTEYKHEYRHVYTRADGKVCANCGVIDTPCWRKFGDLDMCNACAVYAKTHDGKNRPVNLIDRRPAQRAAPKRTPDKTSQTSSQCSQQHVAPVKKLTARAAAMIAKQNARRAQELDMQEEEEDEEDLPVVTAAMRKPRSGSGAAAAAVVAAAAVAAAEAAAAAAALNRKSPDIAQVAPASAPSPPAAADTVATEKLHAQPKPPSHEQQNKSSGAQQCCQPTAVTPPSPTPTAAPPPELPALHTSDISSTPATPLLAPAAPTAADMLRVLNLQALAGGGPLALQPALLQQPQQRSLEQAHSTTATPRTTSTVFLRLIPAAGAAATAAGPSAITSAASALSAPIPTTTATGGMLPLGPLRFAQVPGQTLLLNGRTVLLTAPHIQLVAASAMQPVLQPAASMAQVMPVAATPAVLPAGAGAAVTSVSPTASMPVLPMLAGHAGAPGIVALPAGAAAFATS